MLSCLRAVEQTGKNTFFGRTATLLQSVENLGNLQKILMRVVIVLLVGFHTCRRDTVLRSQNSETTWDAVKQNLE